MPIDPNDITYVRPRLAKRRKGAPHVHEFRLVESCDCCGVQIDLFEALLPDAATDLAGDTSDQSDPEMHLLGVTGLGDAVVGVSHRLRATPAADGLPGRLCRVYAFQLSRRADLPSRVRDRLRIRRI